jgi:coenzyme F420-reducing hydrogenase delta subunit
LEEAGLAPDRLHMINIGAADARRFVHLVEEMVDTVRRLGPSPLNRSSSVKEEMRV